MGTGYRTYLFSRVGDAEDLQLFFGQTDAAEHQTVAAERLHRVDAHAAHHFLDLMPPCGHQVDEPLASLL